jgi:[FeFe] hydrogenase H-cluster maturation GTPase HydF
MFNTPKGNRAHIAILGKRNVGKSSFLNAFIGQDLCIVSDTPGTTTDPVEKAYELQPIGPVLFIDTAGIDDEGVLGEKRIEKTQQILERTDVGLLLVDDLQLSSYDQEMIAQLKKKKTPWLLVINKKDQHDKEELNKFQKDMSVIYDGVKILACSTINKEGIEEINEGAVEELSTMEKDPPLLSDLVKPGELVVLVTPIDAEAPKNRLILPEAQTLRECLDNHNNTMVVQATELKTTLETLLKVKPKLVVTDSQAFEEVHRDTPEDIPLTSFSILFARQKGDLNAYIEGVKAIDELKDGDTVMISELCSHRPIGEDIGRIKIPRWLKEKKGVNLNFETVVGKNYPSDLSKYKMIIQCGGCVANRKQILSRIQQAKEQNVPITNYGITIAYLHGALERAMRVFS